MSRVRASPPAGSRIGASGQRSTGVAGPTWTGMLTWELSTSGSVSEPPSITCKVTAPGPV